MAWDGSGNFNRTQNFTADKNAGLPNSIVDAEKMDSEFNNVKAGLQNCLARDGQNSPSANIDWANNKITGLGTPTAAADAATKGYIDTAIGSVISGSGPEIHDLTLVTPTTGDELIISDLSDSNLAKKISVSALLALLNDGRVAQTGDVKFGAWTTAPTGWVLGFGTIGNAASGATNRANADTSALFTLLWNGWADAQAPVSGGRGASAAADFAAGKTIGIDFKGMFPLALDNMGGTDGGRLPMANTIGLRGGSATKNFTSNNVTLTEANLPYMTPTIRTGAIGGADTGSVIGYSNGSGTSQVPTTTIVGGANPFTVTTSNADILPPYMLFNFAIKL